MLLFVGLMAFDSCYLFYSIPFYLFYYIKKATPMPHLISETPYLGWRVLMACGHCALWRHLLSPVTHHFITQSSKPPTGLVSRAGLVTFWLGL